MKRVAIVERDAAMALLLTEVCRTSGYEIVGCVGEAPAAPPMIERERPDFVLLEFNLGDNGNGLELVDWMKLRCPTVFTIMITAWDINDIASRIYHAQPDRILRKPVHIDALVKVMAAAQGHSASKIDKPRNICALY